MKTFIYLTIITFSFLPYMAKAQCIDTVIMYQPQCIGAHCDTIIWSGGEVNVLPYAQTMLELRTASIGWSYNLGGFTPVTSYTPTDSCNGGILVNIMLASSIRPNEILEGRVK